MILHSDPVPLRMDEPAANLVRPWTADQQRIVLTHDRATMPAFANERLEAGEEMTGLVWLTIAPQSTGDRRIAGPG